MRAAATVLVLAVPAAAAAQVVDSRPCMTRPEMDALITVALPDMLTAGRLVCRRTLPPTAFLRRDLDGLEQRLRAEATLDMAAANAAFRRTSDRPIPQALLGTLRQLAGLTPFYRLLSNKDAQQCATLDALLSKLDTQPGREVAALIREPSITAVEDPELPSYRLCPPVTP